MSIGGRYVLGIDTGGTFTDAVIIDLYENEILEVAKTPTTHYDLSIGISEVVDRLDHNKLRLVSRVCLSTTLATNSILEGKGDNVGLVLIGFDITRPLPVAEKIVVEGGHDSYGEELCPLDRESIERFCKRVKDKVASFAVSSYFSVRNPEHELEAKKTIREVTGKPVICGHELSRDLGAYERTLTAIFNARILSLVESLIRNVKKVLEERGVSAQIYMVKGDGSLIPHYIALERPIETVYSGPAASATGALYLSRSRNAIIVDMGGTSTDIAILSDGKLEKDPKGALVGNFRISVPSYKMLSIGVGGDSMVKISRKKVVICSERVNPISYAATKYPELAIKLEKLLENDVQYLGGSFESEVTFFVYEGSVIPRSLSERELLILKSLKSHPKTIGELVNCFDKHPKILQFYLDSLVKRRVLTKISFTPTDALHVEGSYTDWDVKSAILAAKILAKSLNTSVKELANLVKEKIAREIAKGLIIASLTILEKNSTYDSFLQKIGELVERINEGFYPFKFSMNYPIVAIGAPVKAYLPLVTKYLRDADIVIPKYHQVANAVGAAVANVMVEIDARIRILPDGIVVVTSPEIGKRIFSKLEEAKNYAESVLRALVFNKILGYGVDSNSVKIEVTWEDLTDAEGTPLGANLRVRAIWDPVTNWA